MSSIRCTACEVEVKEFADINFCFDCGVGICNDCQTTNMAAHRCLPCNRNANDLDPSPVTAAVVEDDIDDEEEVEIVGTFIWPVADAIAEVEIEEDEPENTGLFPHLPSPDEDEDEDEEFDIGN